MKQDNVEAFGGCAIAGISFGLSFPPFGLTGFAFIAPAWMLVAVSCADGRRAFLLALTFWLGAWGLAFGWVVGHRLLVAGFVSGVALLALMGLAAAASMGFGVFRGSPVKGGVSLSTNGSLARGSRWRPATQTQRILAGTVGMLSMEGLLLYGPIPMPWVMSGLSQASSVWTSSLAAVVGTTGLSVLVMGVAALLAVLARGWPFRVWPLALAGAILLSVAPSPFSTTSLGDDLTVHIVQPGLDADSWADVENPDRNRDILSLVDSVHSGLDLIILPETALVGESNLVQKATQMGVPLLAGAILETGGSQSQSGPEGSVGGSEGDQSARSFTNSALLATPDAPLSRYDKRIMVPFAERTPLSGVLPFLEQVSVPAGGVRRYEAGPRNDSLVVSGLYIQPLICFESLFPRLVDPKADLIVVLTQDGWWDSRAAREQHFLFSRMLGIQSGRPLIQASVDGISGAFDAGGQLLSMSRQETRQDLVVTMPTAGRATLYRRIGNWPALFLMALTTVFLLLFRHDD